MDNKDSNMLESLKKKTKEFYKKSSIFLTKKVQVFTLTLIVISLIITLILFILANYSVNSDSYYLVTTYISIISVIICIMLFVNLCNNYEEQRYLKEF